ncbi:TIGR03936 family radical SAM-associated protein [Actinomadura vinacea]|uniref:TIGR03936 family radical SAM-associated protein n=1 Tax=Actinomadura vinacea TaxID=115336 RepID=A0ABP5XEW1_9ACTN
MIQRLRVRYAKRGRLRFTSHRDISRAVERAVRRAGIPVAFSAGFSPHPKISYTGAAATGVASEAEYLEIGLSETRDPARVRADLDAALPDGLDIVDAVAVGREKTSALADRLEASEWRVRLDGVHETDAAEAVAAFLGAKAIEVERLTKKGRRRFDVRAAVVALEPDRRAAGAADAPCAILRMVVRHTTPAVRPDDILTGLRQVADLAPPSPPLVTRLAQGPLDAVTGELADPLELDRGDHSPDREAVRPSGAGAVTARGPALPQSDPAASADVAGARS